jgi:manganese/zinc/iron transport system permease protein
MGLPFHLLAQANDWPSLRDFINVLTLQNYNTRVVVLGTSALGLAAGVVGAFALLRKRALLGDALSHATYPGIGAAFMIQAAMGGSGKSLPILLLGATIAGLLGVGLITLINRFTRLKEDAALGIVLSVFFGFGVVLDSVIQKMNTGSAAGLGSFIYGKTASMVAADALIIGIAAVAITLVTILLFKELTLLCFDRDFAQTQGWPVTLLDLLLMILVTGITVLGLQAVGLILVIALLIIPAAAARFWTERLSHMVIISAVIGVISGYVGASVSALLANFPAGAIIVLAASGIFIISMFFGTARGILRRSLERRGLSRRVLMQHLLRAAFEAVENRLDQPERVVPFQTLLAARSWSASALRSVLARAQAKRYFVRRSDDLFQLTDLGLSEGRRIVRNHRLWELYLITHADVATNHADRDADTIEHVLGNDMVESLEELLSKVPTLPESPHPLPAGVPGAGGAK